MNTAKFEALLQKYLALVDRTDRSDPDTYVEAEAAAYEALTEAAGLLSVSMLKAPR